AHAGALGNAKLVHARAEKAYLARVRLQRSGDLMDQRRLAGAVWADQRVEFTGAEIERNAIGRLQRAEGFRHVADVEDGFNHDAASRPKVRQGRRVRRERRRAAPARGRTASA